MSEIKNIATALVNAQKAFGPALKTSTNPHFRSRYADLSACIEAVVSGLNDNGIMLLQQLYESPSGVTVETVFLHESGEMLNCGRLFMPAQKQDAQGFGAALTYARRYSLMAACGIAPEDNDGHGITQKVAPKTEIKKTQDKQEDKAIAPETHVAGSEGITLYEVEGVKLPAVELFIKIMGLITDIADRSTYDICKNFMVDNRDVFVKFRAENALLADNISREFASLKATYEFALNDAEKI